MKLVIEVEIGTSAVKSYANALKIIRAAVGLAQSSNLHLAKPEYGDGGPLFDAKKSTVGWWKVDVSGDQRLATLGCSGTPPITKVLQ
jgi:hypothetical protein